MFRHVISGSLTFAFLAPTLSHWSCDFSVTLTTPALDRRSLRWFGVSPCRATPEGQPPSLMQPASVRFDLLPRYLLLLFRDTPAAPFCCESVLPVASGGPGGLQFDLVAEVFKATNEASLDLLAIAFFE